MAVGSASGLQPHAAYIQATLDETLHPVGHTLATPPVPLINTLRGSIGGAGIPTAQEHEAVFIHVTVVAGVRPAVAVTSGCVHLSSAPQ